MGVAGPAEGRVFTLGPEPFTIGRQSSNALKVAHESVSRRHCVLETDDAGVVLRDLGSHCGTFVNGVPVRHRRLEHSDFVKVGNALFLVLLQTDDAGGGDSSVRVAESVFSAESTVEMRSEEAVYLRPEDVLASLGPGERTARSLNALLRISRAVHELRETGPLARQLAELVAEAVPAERVAVLLFDDAELVPAHVVDHGGGDGALVLSRTLVDRVLGEGVAVLSQDVHGDAALREAESLHTAEVRSLICAPLGPGESSLGVLYADTREARTRFDLEHLELLSAAATIAAPAFANVRRMEELEAENKRLRAVELDHDLVGESPAMERALELVARVAPTDLTVLVIGESGTGKELVAQALHRNSPRAEGPFVAINCATLSETLLESELFGHERGAFTGAVDRKPGKLELADGGTVFLDEVGEIPAAVQARLLRALETREFERVGGTRTLRVDVRVVAATNRDLEAAIAEGTFRRDLYHRLNLFGLPLPPLRERGGDVSLLASHFAGRAGERQKRPFRGFAPGARTCLERYDWPGNVRELQNAMERAVVLAEDGLIRPEDLPEALVEGAAPAELAADGYHARVNAAKRRILLDAVRRAGGNVKEAARDLDLNRTYIHRLINNLELRDELDEG